MLIVKRIAVEGTEYPVTISDDSQALQAAYAAGGAILGIWTGERQADDSGFSLCLYLLSDPEAADAQLLERVVRRRYAMPWIIGETKRLLIREFDKKDPLPPENIGDFPVFTDKTERDAYIDNRYRFYECGLWALVEKHTGIIVGTAGITDGELGYHIYSPYRRQGYAFEACAEILQYAKEEMGLEEMRLKIKGSNKASAALAFRLGFVISQYNAGTETKANAAKLQEDSLWIRKFSTTTTDFGSSCAEYGI